MASRLQELAAQKGKSAKVKAPAPAKSMASPGTGRPVDLRRLANAEAARAGMNASTGLPRTQVSAPARAHLEAGPHQLEPLGGRSQSVRTPASAELIGAATAEISSAAASVSTSTAANLASNHAPQNSPQPVRQPEAEPTPARLPEGSVGQPPAAAQNLAAAAVASPAPPARAISPPVAPPQEQAATAVGVSGPGAATSPGLPVQSLAARIKEGWASSWVAEQHRRGEYEKKLQVPPVLGASHLCALHPAVAPAQSLVGCWWCMSVVDAGCWVLGGEWWWLVTGGVG